MKRLSSSGDRASIQESQPPTKNVRGKKTSNPGWESGNHWVECERCGSIIRSADAMETWDGLTVCPDDWETRHPQDFVRSRHESIAVSDPQQSESEDVFVDQDCETRSGVAGFAVSGCAICGLDAGQFGGSSPIPPSTFDNSL